MPKRKPAEVFPPGEYIRDEMEARGWTLVDVHKKLGNDPVRCCAFDLAAYVDDKNLVIDARTADDIAMVFDCSRDVWVHLDKAWRGV